SFDRVTQLAMPGQTANVLRCNAEEILCCVVADGIGASTLHVHDPKHLREEACGDPFGSRHIPLVIEHEPSQHWWLGNTPVCHDQLLEHWTERSVMGNRAGLIEQISASSNQIDDEASRSHLLAQEGIEFVFE